MRPMAMTPSKSFFHKFQERWTQTGSLVCVGLDSDIAQLPVCVQKTDNPIFEFNRRIIDATADYTACYKPNLAFYLSDGLRGYEALLQTLMYIPSEIPVIIDCKVGDIGNTMEAYVEGFFGIAGCDAITVNPLMGSDVLKALLKRENSFGFVLCLTSNPSARDYLLGTSSQSDSGNSKADLAATIAKDVNNYPVERIGCVIGATQTSDLKRMRELLPGRLFLVPGIGAQGGDLASVLKYAISSKEQPKILINSSRGIIFKDKSENFAMAAASEAKKLHQEILNHL